MLQQKIYRLPDDVVREHILPYTYKPQSQELCEDIRNYYEISHHLFAKYHQLYKDGYRNEDKEMLLYDIQRFMNKGKTTMFGYVDFYIQFFQRFFMLRNAHRDQIVEFLKMPKYYYFTRDIHGNIGIMKPHEREKLKEFLASIHS